MTREEKAKAYDEALKRAKAVINVSANQGETQAAIETIFPCLAEWSEDERMMREIIRYIREQGNKPTGLPNGSVAVADMLAWLEKRKEQMSEVKDPFDDEQFQRGYNAGVADAYRGIKELYEQFKKIMEE